MSISYKALPSPAKLPIYNRSAILCHNPFIFSFYYFMHHRTWKKCFGLTQIEIHSIHHLQ